LSNEHDQSSHFWYFAAAELLGGRIQQAYLLEMLSSLLRPKKTRRREEHSPFSSRYDNQSSPIAQRQQRLGVRHATADFTETELDDENTEEEDDDEDVGEQERDEEDDDGEEDEDGHDDTPLLPIFSAAHLGKSLWVYS
jgi:hypothetical protein